MRITDWEHYSFTLSAVKSNTLFLFIFLNEGPFMFPKCCHLCLLKNDFISLCVCVTIQFAAGTFALLVLISQDTVC